MRYYLVLHQWLTISEPNSRQQPDLVSSQQSTLPPTEIFQRDPETMPAASSETSTATTTN